MVDPWGLCSVKYDYWSAFEGQGSAYVNDVINYFANIFYAPKDYYGSFKEAGLSTPVAIGESAILSSGKVFGFGTLMEGIVGVDVRSGTETHGWQRKTQLIFGGIGTGATAIAGANSLHAALSPSVSKGLTTPNMFFKGKTRTTANNALKSKYGNPRYSTQYKDAYYNPVTRRSFNVHSQPSHGPTHVDIVQRGNSHIRKVPLLP